MIEGTSAGLTTTRADKLETLMIFKFQQFNDVSLLAAKGMTQKSPILELTFFSTTNGPQKLTWALPTCRKSCDEVGLSIPSWLWGSSRSSHPTARRSKGHTGVIFLSA